MIKLIGLIVTLLGVFINFGYAVILKKVLKVTEPTDEQGLKVKTAGLFVAIIGALIVFLLDK